MHLFPSFIPKPSARCFGADGSKAGSLVRFSLHRLHCRSIRPSRVDARSCPIKPYPQSQLVALPQARRVFPLSDLARPNGRPHPLPSRFTAVTKMGDGALSVVSPTIVFPANANRQPVVVQPANQRCVPNPRSMSWGASLSIRANTGTEEKTTPNGTPPS